MSVVFNPGDKVRLTRGEEMLLGEVTEAYPDIRNGVILAAGFAKLVTSWETAGWLISVVPSTPTPELLPAEPWSVIRDQLGTAWVRQADAMWRHERGDLVDANVLANDPRRMPFVPLDTRESWRASWANEIANWVDEQPESDWGAVSAAIRSEFGGSVVDE